MLPSLPDLDCMNSKSPLFTISSIIANSREKGKNRIMQIIENIRSINLFEKCLYIFIY